MPLPSFERNLGSFPLKHVTGSATFSVHISDFTSPCSTLAYTLLIFLPATFAVVLDTRINILYWCYDTPTLPPPQGWRPDVSLSNFCCPQWVWFLPGRGAAVWLCCPNLYNYMTVGLREIRSWCMLLSDKFIQCFSHFTSCLLTI